MDMKRITKVKIQDAIQPISGGCEVHKDKWWVVTQDDEIMFWDKCCPQCNSNKEITERI